MNIQMPTDEEKKTSIENILEAGLQPPKTIWEQLADMLRAVPLRYVFTGIEDSLFLAVISAIIVCAGTSLVFQETLYIAMFTVSPFLYTALYWLTAWKEFQTGTIEMKMTCRFNLRYMTAVRMLLFSAAGIVFDTAITLIVPVRTGKGDYLRLLAVCLSALFIYAALSLWLAAVAPLKAQLVFPAVWTLGAVICLGFARNWFNAVLLQLPLYILFIILTASLLLFTWQLKRMIADPSKGGLIYADN